MDLDEAAPQARPPAWIGEEVKGHGQGAEDFAGAMPRLASGHLEIRPQLFGQRVLSEQENEQVGRGESHQEAEEPLWFFDLQVEAAQPQVALPITKALLDLHALPVQADDLVRRHTPSGPCRREGHRVWSFRCPRPGVAAVIFTAKTDGK